MPAPVSPSRALVAALALAVTHAAAAQSLPRVDPSTAGDAKAAAAPDGAAAPRESPPAADRTAPALRYKDPEPVRSPWRRSAGRWSTGIGLALLAGGATVAAVNQRLSNDLEDRYYRNLLRSSDAAKYDRVRQYNLLSTAMLVTGGAAASVGVVLWSTAPEIRPTRGGATFGVQGRF